MAEATQDRPRGARSLFRTILAPLLCLLAVEIAILIGMLYVAGVMGQLEQNAREIADKQVENRLSDLESDMVENWSDLNWLVRRVNGTTQSMLEEGTLSLEELDSSAEACTPLLLEVGDELISALYARQVSGIFLVFNTDASQGGGEREKTGICIRNPNPGGQNAEDQSGLLLERAPAAAARALNIAASASWDSMFRFSEEGFQLFFRPCYAAAAAQQVEDPADYGCWSTESYTLRGSGASAISYSVPLVLEDGTVYGVLGVELLSSYLRGQLPWEELLDGQWASYCLAAADPQGQTCRINLVSGPGEEYLSPGDALRLAYDREGNPRLELEEEGYYVSAAPFDLYGGSARSEEEQWLLLGVVREEDLYAFSNQMRRCLYLALFCTLAEGVLGAVFISRRVSRPVRGLYRELVQAGPGEGKIPTLPGTGILEIDQFSRVFTALSQDALDASTKLLRIMEMASVEIGGFELRQDEGKIFVTENLFPMFGCGGVDAATLTVEEFHNRARWVYEHTKHTAVDEQNTIFQVELPQGKVRYLHMEVAQDGQRRVGLVEDVTQSTLERLRIERERDYDLLTGLLSRRAFYQRAEQLFREPERMGQAVLVMLDLDNLKRTNDRFGHDWGDQYIRRAGQCFAGAVPANALCARISGDEFCLLLYGFQTQEEGRGALENLSRAIRESAFALPNGETVPIGASGGAAWYPGDSENFRDLMRYADFAMYQVKQLGKGNLGEFNRQTYDRQHALIQSRREFVRLLDNQQVSYHFQPLVDGETGETVGYEAFMRPSLPHLDNPEAVLGLAGREGRLYDVERMTLRRTLESFRQLEKQGQISSQMLLFINSVADQRMSQSDFQDMAGRWGDVLPRTVLEFSARRRLDPGALELKRMSPGFSGMTALDNCTGAETEERALWLLSPQFVKLDPGLVSGLDKDEEKAAAVRRIVERAHSKGIRVVAVGVETEEELRAALSLGADFLQGFYLARPAALPLPVSDQTVRLIRRLRQERAASIGSGTP